MSGRADGAPVIGGPPATKRALERAATARAVVLVEGISDQIALETLGARRGRPLEQEGVVLVPIGGAQAIGRFLARFRSEQPDVRLAGLCDSGEEALFRRGLERAGLGAGLTRSDMERLGFYVCVTDLEDELIRALGPDRVEALFEAQDDLASFRTFQRQLAWRGRPIERQLWRFLRSSSRRNLRYARLLVEGLEPPDVPHPLAGVLAAVDASS